MNESDRSTAIEKRLVALEEWMMHVDQLLLELNGVVCSIQDRLDKHDAAIAQLTEYGRRMANSEPENRTLEDDKPPHY